MNIETNTRITNSLIVDGLKFIAENWQTLSKEEIINGLKDRNCYFSIADVKRSYPYYDYTKKKSIAEGLRDGDFVCAASIIANLVFPGNRDNWSFVCTQFLQNDNEYSIYNFIRVATNDAEYGKDNFIAKK